MPALQGEEDPLSRPWDIIVVGTGAAALTAALAASTSCTPADNTNSQVHEALRPRILLVDKAPLSHAGGNGYYTAAAYRTVHGGLRALLPLVSNVPPELAERVDLPPYSEAEFMRDLERVTDGRRDHDLAEVVVRESWALVEWLKRVGGVDWRLSFRRQAYEVDGRWTFWGGLCLTVEEGGKGLVKALRRKVEEVGCVIVHEAGVRRVTMSGQGKKAAVRGVEVEKDGQLRTVEANSVILCAGGFEASPELRRRWMGPAWEMAHTRGNPYNTGEVLQHVVEGLEAKRVGDFSHTGCHSVAWDADSVKEGGDREKTNELTKSGYPLGLMLNAAGRRFVDEGVDLRNYTYARFGRAILEQPKGIAFQLWDKEGQKWLRNEEYRDAIVRKTTAQTVEELTEQLSQDGLDDPAEFIKTVQDYNDAVAAHRKANPGAELDPAIRDGLSTQSSNISLPLAKSNWALPILEPPFMAVKVTSGITFTFGGLAINPNNAAVLRNDGTEIEGLYCAGEMVGGLFYGNYPGGSGLTAGGVFGRRAGQAAAERTRQLA